MPRLTELQVQQLRPSIVGVPEHGRPRVVYPPLRRRRPPPEGIDDAIADDAPGAMQGDLGPGRFNAKLWPFHVRDVTVNEMAVAVSHPFQGPAYLADGWWQININGAATPGFFTILYREDAPTAGASQTPATLTGQSIFTRPAFASDSGTGPSSGEGLAADLGIGGGNHNPFPIGVFVELTRFFLVAQVICRAAGGASATGWIRVIEGISRDFRAMPY